MEDETKLGLAKPVGTTKQRILAGAQGHDEERNMVGNMRPDAEYLELDPQVLYHST